MSDAEVMWSLFKSVREIVARDSHPNSGDGAPLDQALEKLLTDSRQDRVGENGIDHAPPAFALGAAADDELHDVFVIVERNLVIILHAAPDALELQPHD